MRSKIISNKSSNLMPSKTAEHSQFDFKGNPNFCQTSQDYLQEYFKQKITGNIHNLLQKLESMQ